MLMTVTKLIVNAQMAHIVAFYKCMPKALATKAISSKISFILVKITESLNIHLAASILRLSISID